MTDTTFKTAQTSEPTIQEQAIDAEKVITPQEHNVTPPFTEYLKEKKVPYTAEYFGIQNLWNDETFSNDIKKLENYFIRKIASGDVKDDIGAVEKKIKSIEKMIELDGSETDARKLMKLSAFIDYLEKINY